MERVLVRRHGDEWQWAPWNDGAGGRYEAINDADAVELWQEALRGRALADAGGCFIAENYGGSFENPTPLTTAKRTKEKHVPYAEADDRRVEVTLPAWAFEPSETGLPALPTNGAEAVADVKGLSLAVATVDGVDVVVWLDDGGQAAWIESRRRLVLQRRQEAEAHRVHAQQRAATAEHDGQQSFINPYTYAPLPETVVRFRPRGHASLGVDGLSGWFDWQLTLATPMLMPVEQKVTNGTLELPGSGLRGALRNLHENLAGGCLRILDADLAPVHRDPMAMNRQGYRLAVVEQVDPVTGRVTQLRLTTKLAWVNRTRFNAPFGAGGLYSGQLCHIDDSTRTTVAAKRRDEIPGQNAVSTGTDWVMHISSSMPQRDAHNYYVAVGELSGPVHKVSLEHWQRFVRVCEGSDDLRGVRRPADTSGSSPGGPDWPGAPVRHGRTVIGSRRKVDGWLAKGDTVWLTPTGDLKMAVIWRSEGQHPVRERIAKELLPCRDPNCLCPTCQVFGSIDNEATDTSEQAAYGSHIRVGWGTAANVTTHTNSQLPPLRSPRPGSGGFTLVTPAGANLAGEREGTPLAHWGSRLDSPEPRPLRGRKFYWHGQEAGGRQVARPHQLQNHTEQLGEAEVVPAETVVTARVWFDNLDGAQLGWLLAAAEPSLLLANSCRIHLGGGKPLGFGSATPKVTNLKVVSGRERYAGAAAANSPIPDFVELAAKEIATRRLEPVHNALTRILQADAVHSDRLWYPTPQPFSQMGTEDFDKSFEWFAGHNGGRAGSLTPLPLAVNRYQYLATEVQQG